MVKMSNVDIELSTGLNIDQSVQQIKTDIASVQKRLDSAGIKISLKAEILDEELKKSLSKIGNMNETAVIGKKMGDNLATNLINAYNIKSKEATEQAKQFNSSLSNTGAAKKLDQYLKELPADLDYLESKFQGAKFKMPEETVQSFASMRSLLSQINQTGHRRLPCTISCQNSSIRQHNSTNSLHRSRKTLHLHRNYRTARICLEPKLILG